MKREEAIGDIIGMLSRFGNATRKEDKGATEISFGSARFVVYRRFVSATIGESHYLIAIYDWASCKAKIRKRLSEEAHKPTDDEKEDIFREGE